MSSGVKCSTLLFRKQAPVRLGVMGGDMSTIWVRMLSRALAVGTARSRGVHYSQCRLTPKHSASAWMWGLRRVRT